MRRFLMILLAVVSLLVVLPEAKAEYIFSNGYWWSGGQAYSRARVYYYDSCGCRRYRYQYAKAAKATTTISSETDNYTAKLLEIKANREKWQAQIEASANKHNEFIEKLRELGLNGEYYQTSVGVARIDRSNPYAINGGGSMGYGGYSQRTAEQGSTHFGYVPSSFTVADVYGNVDIGGLYNAAIRLASDSNQYGSKATDGAMTLVDRLGDRAASLMDRAIAVKETEAKAAGIAQLSHSLGQAIKAEARAYIATHQGGNGQPPEPDPALQEDIANGTLNDVGAIITHRCVVCHRPGGKMERLDLTDIESLGDDGIRNILERINSSDPKLVMPPPPNDPLTVHELRVVNLAAVQPAKKE